jgi:hypothetical protein
MRIFRQRAEPRQSNLGKNEEKKSERQKERERERGGGERSRFPASELAL